MLCRNLNHFGQRNVDLKVSEEEIIWPSGFNKLKIYNSRKSLIPKLTNSNITTLRIEGWQNLKNISAISGFKNLKSLFLQSKDLSELEFPSDLVVSILSSLGLLLESTKIGTRK